MRREHDAGPLSFDGRHDFLDGRRREGSPRAVFDGASLQDDLVGWDARHLEDLRPTEAEPPIPNHQALFVRAELSRDGFHTERAAAGDDHDRLGVIDSLERRGDVVHDALE